eukprot:scaffold2629_cov152-Amphora_coffeaeformis.AAC.1
MVTTSSSSSQTGSKDTNVRVVARIRPLSAKEIQAGSHETIRKLDGNGATQLVQVNGADNEKRWFELDAVCDGTSTQAAVYEQSGAQQAICQDLFAGFNTSILAYGQTGAGKTHTMGTAAAATSGDDSDTTLDENAGIIPRACADLFQSIREKCDKAVVTLSYLELYNEQIRDLFSDDPKPDPRKLKIRETPDGAVQVVGCVERKVKNPAEIGAAMEEAGKRRVVAATAMNATSSRSHAICTLRIKGILKDDGIKFASKLQLVDLAGSERIKKTGAQGARQTEGININKSLLVLGQVVSALSSPASASRKPPYRDSKLTRLLQDSLGGNSRTILLACVSPAHVNLDETTNTLRYASSARRITNKVRQNVASVESSSARQIATLQKENTKLNSKVEDLEATVRKLRIQLLEEQAKNRKRPTTPTLSQSNYTASTAAMSDDDCDFDEETSLGEATNQKFVKKTPSATKVPQQINFTQDGEKEDSPEEKDDESVSSAPKTADQLAMEPMLLDLSNHKLMVVQLKERLDTFELLEAQNEELHRKLAEVRAEADTARMAATYLSDIVDELRDIKQSDIEKKKQELQMTSKEKRWVSFVHSMLENFRINAADLSTQFELDIIRTLENLKVSEEGSTSPPSSPKKFSGIPSIPTISEAPASPSKRAIAMRSSATNNAVPSQDELLRMALESPRSPRRRLSITSFSSLLWKPTSDSGHCGNNNNKILGWTECTTKFQQKIRRIERMIAAE